MFIISTTFIMTTMRKMSATLLIFVAMTLASASEFASTGVKTLIFPQETDNSYAELFPKMPLSLKALTLCMRLATEMNVSRNVVLFAYHTHKMNDLQIWREIGRLSFYLDSNEILQIYTVKSPDLGVQETHLCVTWDSRTGLASFYVDGRRLQGKVYKKGHHVPAGGRVILGQDPDHFLGSFDAAQSYVGEIRDVNMWDYVLSPWLIKDVHAGKFVLAGNIFDWNTILVNLNGNVEMVN